MIWHHIPRTRFIVGLPDDIRPIRVHLSGWGFATVFQRVSGFEVYCQTDSGWPVIDRRRFIRLTAREKQC